MKSKVEKINKTYTVVCKTAGKVFKHTHKVRAEAEGKAVKRCKNKNKKTKQQQ